MTHITNLLAPAAASLSLHPDPNFWVCRVMIYLYRAASTRPLNAMFGRIASQPDYPFRQVADIPTHGPYLEFYADLASQVSTHPLRFHALIMGFHLLREPCDLAPYNLTGGHGAACPDDDARTLRDLLSALHSFPAGWHIGFDHNDPNDGKINEDDENDPIPA